MAHRLANLELSELLSSPVKTRDGEMVGRIQDIILNVRDGRIEYVKLAVEGSERAPQRCVAVPWSQFKLVNVAADVELNISRKVLKMCAASTP
ncbi:MAG: PRC-barrel domain-containing protein [Halioglobus sp.]|nr:PRC-barrel domain-containing protein [Halioglobus sp.]